MELVEEIDVETEPDVIPVNGLPEEVIPEENKMDETITLLDNGCYSNEVYLEEEETCSLVINCKNERDCIKWGNELIELLEFEYGSLVLEESVATGEEGITVLTTYDIDNEEEVIYTDAEISDEELEYHENLWFSFSWLIPESERREITQFEVFESGNTLAYVTLHDENGEYWTLGMNNKNIELASEILVTYLHEYAHFLSLNQNEIDYWKDEAGCDTLYLQDSGCFYEDAYLTSFYREFWEVPGYGDIDEFFVSNYARESPEEDFSESFAHFVLTQTPEGDTVREGKILFFYEFEELVQLRTEILSRVATWLVRL